MARRRYWGLSLALTLLVGSCLQDTSPLAVVPTTPSASEALGLNQTGTVGDLLSNPLVVRVTDRFGNPVDGVPVSWTVDTGGGGFSEAATATDARGEARAAWRLGTVAGANAASASVPGLGTSRFEATGLPGAPAQLSKSWGDLQARTVATTLPDSLVVKVTDRYGNVVVGAVVSWVAGASGVVTPNSSTTNAAGEASTRWTLGNTAGPGAVTASVGGETQAVFTAVASAGPAARVTKHTGDGQTATVGSPLTDSLVLTVTDQYGNAVAAAQVAWAVTGSGGAVSPATTTTDVSGRARTRWTLHTLAGSNGVTGSVTGLPPAVFAATGTAGPPASIIKVRGDGQNGSVGSALTDSLVVRIRDSFDNPVRGVLVTWSVTSGGGSVSPPSAVTDVNGESRVQWTLGATTGTNSVNAIATGLTSVAFNATGATASGLNLTIAAVTLTQVTQTVSGSVPLIQGRPGYLRVFVTANQVNTATPPVRVRFYAGGSLVSTQTIPAPTTTVPLALDESQLAQSWNVPVAGSLIQSGLSLLVDVDPLLAVPESNDSDNNYPATGVPLTLDVRSPSSFNTLLVPVLQSVNGTMGNVTTANRQNFLDFAGKVFPLTTIDAPVRAPYTTSAPTLQANDANDAWTTILNELLALRVAEGGTRHYYGVVRTPYASGVAGLGFIGFPVAMGWDRGDADEVAAHEWGHNFGRRHAPSCNAGGPDPGFPYAQGRIGVYGFDPTAGVQYSPFTHYDLMGYCGPSWISDYTYRAILNYRAASPAPGVVTNAQEPSLLLWGRIGPEALVLEPAFEVTTSPALPEGPGPYTLEGLDEAGAVIFSLSFAALEVADTEGRHFAFAVPSSQASPDRLARLRLSAPGLAAAERRGAPAQLAPPVMPQTLEVRRVTPGTVEVRWDPAAAPVVMVRDAATGAILSFARGGVSTLAADASGLELVVSDGVRSSVQQVTVP